VSPLLGPQCFEDNPFWGVAAREKSASNRSFLIAVQKDDCGPSESICICDLPQSHAKVGCAIRNDRAPYENVACMSAQYFPKESGAPRILNKEFALGMMFIIHFGHREFWANPSYYFFQPGRLQYVGPSLERQFV